MLDTFSGLLFFQIFISLLSMAAPIYIPHIDPIIAGCLFWGSIVGIILVSIWHVKEWLQKNKTYATSNIGELTEEKQIINIPGNNNILSVGQSGGITTGTYINQSDPPRRLTSEQITALQIASSKVCSILPFIHVTASNGNHEAQRYAMDFVNVFNNSGCKSDLSLPIPGLTPDVTDIRLGVRDINNIDYESKIMINILEEAEFHFFINAIKPDFFPNEKFVLIIGAKQ